jgi:hypothetical protein
MEKVVTYYSGTKNLSVALRKEFINGKPWSPRIQRFSGGFLKIFNHQEHAEKIVELLDNDPRCGVLYQRFSKADLDAIADHKQEGIAHSPAGGITDEMKEKLQYVEEKSDKKSWVPTEAKKVLKTLEEIIECFQVHGIRNPEAGDSARKMKSLILDILDILETQEIYPVKEE